MSGETPKSFQDKVESKRYSLLCAMGHVGIIHWELVDTTKKGVNGERFLQFLQNLIVIIANHDVILYLDNAKIHKIREVRGLLRAFGVSHLFSSPYSPDYNPIEYLFSYVKHRIKDKFYENMNLHQTVLHVMNQMEDGMEDQEKTCADLCTSWINFAALHWESEEI
jgi:transposase